MSLASFGFGLLNADGLKEESIEGIEEYESTDDGRFEFKIPYLLLTSYSK